MNRRPGKPTIHLDDAKPFWAAIQTLYKKVENRGGYAELGRMAKARRYEFTSTALRAQVLEQSRPSQEMQRCIAAMSGVSVDDIIRAYGDGPKAKGQVVRPPVDMWRAAVEMAAAADGFSETEIARFFAAHPERGTLNVAAALAIMGALRRAG